MFKGKDKTHLCNNSVWNKGKKGVQIAWNKGKKMSEGMKKKLSLAKTGKKNPKMTGINNPRFGKEAWNKGLKTGKPSWASGRKMPKEIRAKISGKNHYKWKGGVGSVNMLLRKCYEYRQWVQDIFKRDGYTCQTCGVVGGKLNAHHIKPFSVIIKENKIKTKEDGLDCLELWNFENGQTLCVPCHKKTDSYLKTL